MLCCTLLYVHSSFVIILTGKRELVAILSLSSWCLVIVVGLFLAVPWVCLQFVVVVFLTILTIFKRVLTCRMLCTNKERVKRVLTCRMLCTQGKG